MSFLPIVGRELLVASRRRTTYWIRTAAVVGVLFVGGWVFLMMQQRPPAVLAPALFYVLTGGAVVYAWAMGINATADCLSREKREGTLGLLFLTDLRGYDIVLGKLAATSLNSIYSLLAIVPMLAIPLLMGGIAPGEFWRMSLVAVNALFFSLALGMLVSVLSRSAAKALGAAGLVLLCVNGLLPACGAMLSTATRTHQIHPAFLLASTGYSYGMAFETQHRGHELQFWLSAGVINLLGWAFLAMTALLAPRCWQQRTAGASALRWRDRWKLWALGDSFQRAAYRRKLLDESPFFWLTARLRMQPAYVWLWIGLIAGWWAWGLFRHGNDWLSEPVYLATALLLSLLLRCWWAVEASRTLAQERANGRLELLLSTPLTVKEILHGQWLALKRQFLVPVLVLVGAECFFLVATLSDLRLEADRPFWLCFWLALIVMELADFWSLYWVGLWRGLTSRNPHMAALDTILEVLTTPWLLIAGVFLFAVLGSMAGGRGPGFSGMGFLGLWCLAGLLVDVGLGLHAQSQLQTNFRGLAARSRAYRSKATPSREPAPAPK